MAVSVPAPASPAEREHESEDDENDRDADHDQEDDGRDRNRRRVPRCDIAEHGVQFVHRRLLGRRRAVKDTPVVAARLTAQQLSGAPAREPEEVARRLLAVQAQNARGARLAVRAGRPVCAAVTSTPL
jgi:hypothetical protein